MSYLADRYRAERDEARLERTEFEVEADEFRTEADNLRATLAKVAALCDEGSERFTRDRSLVQRSYVRVDDLRAILAADTHQAAR